MRKALIIGNWKMNGNLAENDKLLNTINDSYKPSDGVEVVICPPSPYLAQVTQQLLHSKIKYGAQNVNAQKNGAHTGEVSTSMLYDLGCSYVLLGHSERRSLYQESNIGIAYKFSATLLDKMIPVLCVGETLAQRQCDETFAVIAEQISSTCTKFIICCPFDSFISSPV